MPFDRATAAATASSRPTARRAVSLRASPTLMRKSYSGIHQRSSRRAVEHLEAVGDGHHVERCDRKTSRARARHEARDEAAGDPDSQAIRARQQLPDGAADGAAARRLLHLAAAGTL